MDCGILFDCTWGVAWRLIGEGTTGVGFHVERFYARMKFMGNIVSLIFNDQG